MNPFIKALIGQAAAPETVGNPIDVVGQAGSQQGPRTYDEYSLNNAPAVIGRGEDIKQTEEASDRRGLFGTRGTLRDILGVLGDAFLVQSGNKPVYGPSRRREQVSDAMAGFTVDPVAAAERVAYYDPMLGQELLSEAQTQRTRQAQQESLAASRENLVADRDFKNYVRAREQIGGLFNTPGAVVDGAISPQALAIAERIANSANMTLEDFMIAEGMTEQQVRDYALSVLDPYQQERLEDYDIGLTQGQQNADSRAVSARASMIRAQRPPAGRNPPQPTEASMLAEFLRIPPEQRTPEQQAFVERKTAPTGRGTSSRRPSSSGQRAPRSNW